MPAQVISIMVPFPWVARVFSSPPMPALRGRCSARTFLAWLYPTPAGEFPQYNAVGKVRVDPNNSNKVAAGAKTGLYLSYDGGVNWTGPCSTNGFSTQRQDITGLELRTWAGA